MRFLHLVAVCAVTAALSSPESAAQTPLPPNGEAVQPLEFPAQAEVFSDASRLRMALYKPAGTGRFPAIVISPTCGGFYGRNERAELLDWAKRAIARGYAVLLLDHFTQRGISNNCTLPNMNTLQGLKDASAALAHLAKFPEIDAERVGLIGFLRGAIVGLWASSRGAAVTHGDPVRRFRAIASFYPLCRFGGMGARAPNEYLRNEIIFVRDDLDRPLLVLMGKLDNETPPADCTPRLEALKARNLPVEWHVYPKTTHCWDCSSLDGLTKQDFRGNWVHYRHSIKTTEDSGRRTFEFFDTHLKAAVVPKAEPPK